jgi:hypothetical protein
MLETAFTGSARPPDTAVSTATVRKAFALTGLLGRRRRQQTILRTVPAIPPLAFRLNGTVA